MIIEIDDYKFDVDIAKTKEYYKTHSLCDCDSCRIFCERVSEKYPTLSSFLGKFGIDISKPDELGYNELTADGLNYHFASYTVCGSVIASDMYEIDIHENGTVSIVVDNRYIPNDQESNNYFVLTVYGIMLPVKG